MKTQLFVFTGTGNSLWVARQLAQELKEADLGFMPILSRELKVEADRVGLVFPVHIWGLPAHVIQFINHLRVNAGTYIFALAVNAGQHAATLLQLQKLMVIRKLSLALGYSIALPSNYIPWGGPGPVEKQQRLFEEARKKIRSIAQAILQAERKKVERGPHWQNIPYSLIYKMSFRSVRTMDKKFHADEKCNGCGICSRVCPASNVEMIHEKPLWLHHCEQCLACLQWCPKEAIQVGEKTVQYPRYHHPEVLLKDMLEQAEANKAYHR
jgi:formate hydrogenlyase subunit 6/NADH:ubiquinone oxidoreductase subunit I